MASARPDPYLSRFYVISKAEGSRGLTFEFRVEGQLKIAVTPPMQAVRRCMVPCYCAAVLSVAQPAVPSCVAPVETENELR